MAEYYITEERAFATGIAGEWPKVIQKPDNPHGRLVKLTGMQNLLERIIEKIDDEELVKEIKGMM